MMHTDAGCWLLAGGLVAMGVIVVAAFWPQKQGRVRRY